MEVLFNITNLKSLITFVHLGGLAIGVGGAWMLDAFIIKHVKSQISRDKFDTIEFVSKFVLAGLVMLWLSGFLFIAFYYFYTPEYLQNQKVWGKLFIVVVLTLNGFFVHKAVLPKLRQSIGKNLISSIGYDEITKMTIVGAISFVSWLFPIILGVAKTLNFTTPASDIILFYLATLALTVILATFISKLFIQNQRAEIAPNYTAKSGV